MDGVSFEAFYCVCVLRVSLSSCQMVGVGVVKVLGLVRRRPEAAAGHVSAARRRRCGENAAGGRLRGDESAGGRGAVLRQ